MLVRYLAAYEPEGSYPWFTKDPLSVTFSSATAPGVAGAYGYSLLLAVSRSDPPPGTAPPGPVDLDLGWAYTKNFDLLSPFDRHIQETIGLDCKVPTGAVTGTALTQLEPRASYDLFAVAAPTGTIAAPDNRKRTALPPSAFRTSRWASPTAMFKAFGFGLTQPDLLHAVVRNGAVPPALQEPSDAALLAALDRAGLALPSLSSPTRTTVLWSTSGGSPAVVGVLLETDEPLVRGHRVGGLAVDHPAGAVRPVLDRGATAALFWAASAFSSGPLTLRWGEGQSLATQPPSWTVARSLTLAVPLPAAVPSLALEVVG
jgi:hypothetical protein